MSEEPEFDCFVWLLIGLVLVDLFAAFVPWDGYILMFMAPFAIAIPAVCFIVFMVVSLAQQLLRSPNRRDGVVNLHDSSESPKPDTPEAP